MSLNILVVDDDLDLLEITSLALESMPCQTTTIADYGKALHAVEAGQFDIIISDLNICGLADGINILKAAKKKCSRTIVIIMSGCNDIQTVIEVLRHGADDFILKPCGIEEIRQRVFGCLDRKAYPLKGNCVPEAYEIIAHDIRGPLVSMAASMKLLKRGYYGTPDIEVAKVISALLEKTVGLSSTLEEFLRGNSLNEDEQAFEQVDLVQDVLRPVMAEFIEDIQAREIEIVDLTACAAAGAFQVKGNRSMLKSVFRNLISNAVKYGGRGCTITCQLGNGGAYIRGSVCNTGNQVSRKNRKKLFKKYERLDKAGSSEHKGTGLGLYLIREILRKHMGSIRYKAESCGSSFLFRLPAYPDCCTFNEKRREERTAQSVHAFAAAPLRENAGMRERSDARAC